MSVKEPPRSTESPYQHYSTWDSPCSNPVLSGPQLPLGPSRLALSRPCFPQLVALFTSGVPNPWTPDGQQSMACWGRGGAARARSSVCPDSHAPPPGHRWSPTRRVGSVSALGPRRPAAPAGNSVRTPPSPVPGEAVSHEMGSWPGSGGPLSHVTRSVPLVERREQARSLRPWPFRGPNPSVGCLQAALISLGSRCCHRVGREHGGGRGAGREQGGVGRWSHLTRVAGAQNWWVLGGVGHSGCGARPGPGARRGPAVFGELCAEQVRGQGTRTQRERVALTGGKDLENQRCRPAGSQAVFGWGSRR